MSKEPVRGKSSENTYGSIQKRYVLGLILNIYIVKKRSPRYNNRQKTGFPAFSLDTQ